MLHYARNPGSRPVLTQPIARRRLRGLVA